METAHGPDWWHGEHINPNIREEADKLLIKEIDSGMTQRSENMLDYTTFGQLSQIIQQNWSIFSLKLKSRGAVNNIMARLNSLRGFIAHFSPMPDREIRRLELTIDDWFGNLL
jgi:hypothetical protein